LIEARDRQIARELKRLLQEKQHPASGGDKQG
jgi:hypothetical protein